MEKSKHWDYLKDEYALRKSYFQKMYYVYKKLIQKASQWLEHGGEGRPATLLELEIRLNEFETHVAFAAEFFEAKRF